MATWQAECWLGSESGFQTLQVQSNTHHGAKSQFERVYGATQIRNVHEVGDSEGEGFGMDLGSSLTWCLILGGGLLFVYALPFILFFGAIGLVCWGGYKLIKWMWNYK